MSKYKLVVEGKALSHSSKGGREGKKEREKKRVKKKKKRKRKKKKICLGGSDVSGYVSVPYYHITACERRLENSDASFLFFF